MVRGGVSILKWSFERVEVARKVVEDEIGLGIDEEVLGLEEGGMKVIEVEERALREGLGVRCEYEEEYLEDGVD